MTHRAWSEYTILRKTPYYGEPRARACSLGLHWGSGGATLRLWWDYTGAGVGPQWGCDDTQSLVGKHYTTVSHARARACSLGLHWGSASTGGTTLGLWWDYTAAGVGHNGAVMTHRACSENTILR